MTGRSEHLRDAFLDDHRVLIHGLADVRAAVNAGDLACAARLADELDLAVGGHIEFEEREFYPTLRAKLGDAFVDQLYDEHAAGRRAIATLRSLAGGGVLDVGARERVLEELRIVQDHALSCGSLTSHMNAMPAEHQREMLAALERCRARGARWTEPRTEPTTEGGTARSR